MKWSCHRVMIDCIAVFRAHNEARLHRVHQGSEITLHEDNISAVHDSHRQELVLGMDENDLKQLARWLGAIRE